MALTVLLLDVNLRLCSMSVDVDVDMDGRDVVMQRFAFCGLKSFNIFKVTVVVKAG